MVCFLVHLTLINAVYYILFLVMMLLGTVKIISVSVGDWLVVEITFYHKMFTFPEKSCFKIQCAAIFI